MSRYFEPAQVRTFSIEASALGAALVLKSALAQRALSRSERVLFRRTLKNQVDKISTY